MAKLPVPDPEEPEFEASSGFAPVDTGPQPKLVLTAEGSHVAFRRGYAAGRIIEADEPVPAGVCVANEWMAPQMADA